MMYIGLIEKRITQLLQQVYYKEKTAVICFTMVPFCGTVSYQIWSMKYAWFFICFSAKKWRKAKDLAVLFIQIRRTVTDTTISLFWFLLHLVPCKFLTPCNSFSFPFAEKYLIQQNEIVKYPRCVEQELVSDVIDTLQRPQTTKEVAESLDKRLNLPQGIDRVHNVSACHLPQSRKIIQMRHQWSQQWYRGYLFSSRRNCKKYVYCNLVIFERNKILSVIRIFWTYYYYYLLFFCFKQFWRTSHG